MQDQLAMQEVTVSMLLEDQQCAMELRVVGCGLAPREWHLNGTGIYGKTIQIYYIEEGQEDTHGVDKTGKTGLSAKC